MSIELRPLIAKGYLSAEPLATDRRLKILALTERGAELLTRLAQVQQKVNDTLYRQFTSQGLVAQCETIEKMIGSAEQANHFLESLAEGGALGESLPIRKLRQKA